MPDIYLRLAKHLENLVMGYPYTEELIDLLKEMFSPEEARVALAIPNKLAPLEVVGLDTIVSRADLPESTVVPALTSLSDRGIIFSAKMADDTQGYALLQVGFGVPQTFFWGGQNVKLFHRAHHRQGLRWRAHQNLQIQPDQFNHRGTHAGRDAQ
jgi:hypothetical protein